MSEPTVADLEKQLERAGRRLARALRGGDEERLAEAKAVYARLKGELVTEAHRVGREAARASRAARQAPQPASSGRWRLPAGFGRSPLAVERDRRPPEPEPEQIPHGGHVSPWRRGGSPASEVIWP